MGTFHVAEALLEPTVNFIRYMPAAAFIPLLMLYIGIDEASKIAIIFIGTYFQLILMVSAEVRNVPIDMIKVSYTLGAKRSHALWLVVVPASLPGLIEALRITLGWAWTYLVVAELIAADQGLGFRIMESQRFLKTEIIFLYILIIGLLGLIFDQSIKCVARRVVPWAESFEK
jgi:NitT/TauT family transport system permease protein